MKKVFKRIIAFSLSICIVVLSILLCPTSVYAFPARQWDGTWVDKSFKEAGDEFYALLGYLASQMGAIVNGDFYQFLTNEDERKGLVNPETGQLWSWVEDSITVNPETDELTFSSDLVAFIKQALLEYADETNPFTIQQTYRARDIPASTFPSKEIYNTFLAYALSHTVTAFNKYSNGTNGTFKVGDVTPLIKEGGGFVIVSPIYYTCNTVNGDWNYEKIIYDIYNFSNTSNGFVITTTQEKYGYFDKLYFYNPENTSFQVNSGSNAFLVTPDGGRIRVFKSLTEFMDYNAGQRKVFFGSGFYDFDPADITATWDDINDKIGHMDDILQDILDEITNNPNISEEDLEKLIDELIGKIGEIGGELGDKADQTNTLLGGISSTLSGIASSLSGYFSSVLSALDEILAAIKALVWIEADNKLDDDKSDLFDLLDKIWEDPENGSQEAADALTASFSDIVRGLTKKFPFSIPWDIYNLFRVFSGAPAPDESSFRPMTLGVDPFTVDNEDLEQDIHDAPYFKLPLRLDSYGIYEEVVIDLSDFKSISTLSRALLSVLFAVFLIKFTILLIDLFKGGAGD